MLLQDYSTYTEHVHNTWKCTNTRYLLYTQYTAYVHPRSRCRVLETLVPHPSTYIRSYVPNQLLDFTS